MKKSTKKISNQGRKNGRCCVIQKNIVKIIPFVVTQKILNFHVDVCVQSDRVMIIVDNEQFVAKQKKIGPKKSCKFK